jgi:hypothetical protein
MAAVHVHDQELYGPQAAKGVVKRRRSLLTDANHLGGRNLPCGQICDGGLRVPVG